MLPVLPPWSLPFLAAPHAPEHSLLHRECGVGMPSELAKSCSPSRRCPAQTSCRAELGQVAEVWGNVLLWCTRDLLPSTRANTAPAGRKNRNRAQHWASQCHRKGSALASLKMGAGKWRKPCLDHENSCSGNSLRNVPVLEQKKASFAGIILGKEEQERCCGWAGITAVSLV